MSSILKVDTIQDQAGNNIINENSNTITIGASGDTINIIGTLQNNGGALPGDISSVVAGTGLSGGGTSGAVTINIEAAQPTITSLGTITSFRSTGIDDNSNALAITINSSEQVGIGTSSPSSLLHLDTNTGDANSPFINFDNNDGNIGQIRMSGSGDFGFRANTGGTGNMFFQTGGGSERMRISSAGLVGIGTTAPGAKLEIQTSTDWGNIINSTNSGTQYLKQFEYNGSSIGKIRGDNSSIAIESGSNLILQTANTERARLNSTGLGIGTSSPATPLHISGTNPTITFQETDQSNRKYVIGSFGNAYGVYDETNSQYRYIVDTNGNHIFNEAGLDCDFRVESNNNANMLFIDGNSDRVGIGINAPVAQLTVGSNSSGNQGVVGKIALFSGTHTTVYNAGNNGTFGGITIVNGDSTSNRTAAGVNFVNGNSGVSSIVGTSDTASRGDLRFITRGADNSGNTSERMRIADNGSVLIGTSTSGSAVAGDLVVNGGVFLGGTATANELDDYEEGTFTPNWTGSSSVSVASGNYGYYTKIGNVVTVHFGAVLSSTSNSYYQITNAPFLSNIPSGSAMGAAREYGHTGYSYRTIMGDNSNAITMVSYINNAVANAYLTCSLTYRTD